MYNIVYYKASKHLVKCIRKNTSFVSYEYLCNCPIQNISIRNSSLAKEPELLVCILLIEGEILNNINFLIILLFTLSNCGFLRIIDIVLNPTRKSGIITLQFEFGLNQLEASETK